MTSKRQQLVSRRRFSLAVLTAAGTTGGWHLSRSAQARAAAVDGRLRIGAIGYGAWAAASLAFLAEERIAAICDVDQRQQAKAAARWPDANWFGDYRAMLDRARLDAVVVGAPAHWQFHLASEVLRRGLPLFCESPIGLGLWEVRELAKQAAAAKAVTQCGLMHRPLLGTRRAIAYLQAGHLGAVREIHAWTDRPRWPQAVERPADVQTPPEGLDWNAWLGPAAERPYHSAYHPTNWRGWFDFGGGALGDMGPHLLDVVAGGLELGVPERISAETGPRFRETYPAWSVVRFEFSKVGSGGPVTLTWYDGGKTPPDKALGGGAIPSGGTLVIGEKGRLFVQESAQRMFVTPSDDAAPLLRPEPLENGSSVYAQWAAACKSGEKTSCDLAYGARLTELCLLGNLAVRTGKVVGVRGEAITLDGREEPAALARPEYREWRR